MLCYAWDKLEYLNRNKVGVLQERDVLNLLCRVFIKELDFLIKKGLFREYKSFEEETSVLRGKINFNESISLMVNKKISLCVVMKN
jgi:5-methylcytosine-specific restriction enzyme subunit McrC